MSEEATLLTLFIEGLGERLSLLPAPEIRIVANEGVDMNRRRIYVGEITDAMGTWFQQVLDIMNARSEAPITLCLNSPGGDVTSMYAIHDAIRTSRAPVRVIASGQVASAAVLILACGAAGSRLVMESTVLMSHEPTVGGDDDGSPMRVAKSRRKWEDWQATYWCELMARYTPGKDAKWWAKTTERQAEYWLLGGAAIVREGLADAVATPGDVAPRLDVYIPTPADVLQGEPLRTKAG